MLDLILIQLCSVCAPRYMLESDNRLFSSTIYSGWRSSVLHKTDEVMHSITSITTVTYFVLQETTSNFRMMLVGYEATYMYMFEGNENE